MWIEIAKLLLSSAITTVVLGFIFNKKIERHKMFLKVGEQYLSSLIIGLNAFMADFKALIGIQELGALRLSLEMLLNENLKDDHGRTREICLKVIPKFKEKYSRTTNKANQITRGVFDGKSPFDNFLRP